jgi:hypothetical protein
LFKNKKLYRLFIVLFILLVFFIPYIVNWLMSFHVTKVYGNTDSWISFLGSYIGSVISGFITLWGVKLSLEFTKLESIKNKLPEKIDNLEECLDLIEENIAALNKFNRLDTPENLSKPARFREKIMYAVDAQYNLVEKTIPNIHDYTTEIEKQLRSLLLKVDAKTYILYRDFSNGLRYEFAKHIQPIKDRLGSFQQELMEAYKESDGDIITTGYLSNIKLRSEHQDEINKILSDLYFAEREYLMAIEDRFFQLREDLLDILQKLRDELD